MVCCQFESYFLINTIFVFFPVKIFQKNTGLLPFARTVFSQAFTIILLSDLSTTWPKRISRSGWSLFVQFTWPRLGKVRRGLGPVSRKPGNFSGGKANFEIKTCWIVAQVVSHKQANFASLTDSFIISFWKLLKLWCWSYYVKIFT